MNPLASIYNSLDPVFQSAHTGIMPIRVNDVVKGVLSEKNKEGWVDRIEFHRVSSFVDVVGALEKVAVLNSENQCRVYNSKKCEFVSHVYFCDKSNYCWQRFAKVKEICQSLINIDEDAVISSSGVSSLIDDLLAAFAGLADGAAGGKVAYSAPFISEALGIYAACEVLFPMRDRHFYLNNWEKTETRETLLKYIEEQASGEVLFLENSQARLDFDKTKSMSHLLAFAYRMPQIYIDYSLQYKAALQMWLMAREGSPNRFGSCAGILAPVDKGRT